MAYQGVNYAAIPVQKPVDLFGSIMEGYQTVGNIRSQKQKQEQMELANKMAQMQLDNAPEQMKQQQAMQQAQLRNAIAQAGLTESKAKNYPQQVQSQNEMLQAKLQNYRAQAQQSQDDLKNQQELSDLMFRAKGVKSKDTEFKGIPFKMPTSEGATSEGAVSGGATSEGAAKQIHPEIRSQYIKNKYPDFTVISEGNPNGYHIDEIAEAKPEYKKILSQKYGWPAEKSETKYNSETGSFDTIITKGSGLTLAKSVPFGLSPAELAAAKTRAEGLAKLDVDSAGRYLKSSDEARKMSPQIDGLIDFTKTPEFNSTVGPISSLLSKTAGGSQARKAFGSASSMLGLIKAQAATQFKGAFKESINNIIDDIKPTMTDYGDVFKGKLNALKMINDANINYGESVASYIRGGMPAEKATKKAEEEFKAIAESAKKVAEAAKKSNPEKKLKLNIMSGVFE